MKLDVVLQPFLLSIASSISNRKWRWTLYI